MGKIIGLVVAAVLLVGIFLYWNTQNDQVATETVQDALPVVVKGEKNTVSSIRDAMGLGQKMQCTYAVNEGGKPVESTVVVDGGKFKSVTTMGAVTTYALFDGESQYSWTSASKTGMKFAKACLENLQQSAQDAAPGSVPQDAEKAFDMANNVKCEAVAVVDLSLPSDVNFTDQCAMMEKSLKMMQDVKGQLPAGVTVPGL